MSYELRRNGVSILVVEARSSYYLSVHLYLPFLPRCRDRSELMDYENTAEASEMSPHVLLFPLPIQSPINSMLQLAELFCLAGLQVTFLNTNHNQQLLCRHTDVQSRFSQYPKFRFLTISDGLPEEHPRSFGELISSLQAVAEPFLREVLLLTEEPAVTCVIPDALFYYAVDIGNEMGVSVIPFDTISPCCLWVYLSFPKLIQAGDIPFKGTLTFHSLLLIPSVSIYQFNCHFSFYEN